MPIEEKFSFNWRLFILWPVMILLLYVLSNGPIQLMREKGSIQADNKLVLDFYRPLDWAHDYTSLHRLLGMYFHWWVPDWYDKDGDWLLREWRDTTK